MWLWRKSPHIVPQGRASAKLHVLRFLQFTWRSSQPLYWTHLYMDSTSPTLQPIQLNSPAPLGYPLRDPAPGHPALGPMSPGAQQELVCRLLSVRQEVMPEGSYRLSSSSSSELRAEESRAWRLTAWVFLLQQTFTLRGFCRHFYPKRLRTVD